MTRAQSKAWGTSRCYPPSWSSRDCPAGCGTAQRAASSSSGRLWSRQTSSPPLHLPPPLLPLPLCGADSTTPRYKPAAERSGEQISPSDQRRRRTHASAERHRESSTQEKIPTGKKMFILLFLRGGLGAAALSGVQFFFVLLRTKRAYGVHNCKITRPCCCLVIQDFLRKQYLIIHKQLCFCFCFFFTRRISYNPVIKFGVITFWRGLTHSSQLSWCWNPFTCELCCVKLLYYWCLLFTHPFGISTPSSFLTCLSDLLHRNPQPGTCTPSWRKSHWTANLLLLFPRCTVHLLSRNV